MASSTRQVRVFRYDPEKGGDGHFDSFKLDCPNESAMTMLDVLLRIQREQDSSIAFRFACRVAMCGSCGMVINGKERLACKTNVSDLPAGAEVTLRPMNHFPVIKDLVVDMDPLFTKFAQTMSWFEAKDDSPEPAVIPPDAPEREEIRLATDCIACGCCVSSCTMVHHHEDYAGPAALARAYSLMADSRDALLGPRLAAALSSCHDCRTEANCTEVCPKGISPTRAIKYIQRLALTANVDQPEEAVNPAKEAELPEPRREIDRKIFLKGAGVALLGAGVAAALGGIGAMTTVGPSTPTDAPEQWIPLAKVSELPQPGQVSTVLMRFDVKNGIYTQPASRPVMISHLQDQIICYKTACPHLGCTVRWDGRSDQFRCACHGGTFNREGEVIGGPPPHGLDKYQHKIEGDQLYVLL